MEVEGALVVGRGVSRGLAYIELHGGTSTPRGQRLQYVDVNTSSGMSPANCTFLKTYKPRFLRKHAYMH
jgi:hypothetical protein